MTSVVSEKKAKQNTGDWRGFPSFLGVLSALCVPLAMIGGGAMGDQSNFLGWSSFFGILIVGLTFYATGAIIAALRGNLRE